MDNIPAVGAAASTEAAGADTAELIYSGAAAAAREAACSAQEEAKGGCGQGSAGESSDAVYRDLSAPAAGVGTATAHARESQFLHRWGCNDLVHEALVELGRHTSLEAAEKAMCELQTSRGVRTIRQEVGRVVLTLTLTLTLTQP